MQKYIEMTIEYAIHYKNVDTYEYVGIVKKFKYANITQVFTDDMITTFKYKTLQIYGYELSETEYTLFIPYDGIPPTVEDIDKELIKSNSMWFGVIIRPTKEMTELHKILWEI